LIISASYKTDIPAFYGAWFLRRLDAGYCRIRNPYSGKSGMVDLSPEAVDGIVFWTRNPKPFMKALEIVEKRHCPFYLQYTITGYPRMIEDAVPPWEQSVSLFRILSGRFGKDSVVWRYDPVLFSSVTDMEFHRRNFRRIASSLEGVASEVVISFTQFYKKTSRRLGKLAAAKGISFYDIPDGEKTAFAAELASTARTMGMELAICGQRNLLAEGIKDACCIDPFRLSRIAGKPIIVPSGSTHRKDCGCYPARDIGEYDTCLHGCEYCYAVSDRNRVLDNFRKHDPESEYLLLPARRNDGEDKNGQGRLF